MNMPAGYHEPHMNAHGKLHRIKRTAYYKDAARNLRDWGDQLESGAMTADKLMEAQTHQD